MHTCFYMRRHVWLYHAAICTCQQALCSAKHLVFLMLQGVVVFYTFCGKMHFKGTCVPLLLHFVVAYNETDPEVPQGDEKTSIEDHGIA